MTIRTQPRRWWIAAALCALALAANLLTASEQPAVRVEPTDSVGPRTLEKQTETAVVRDYLQAWQTLDDALQSNQAGPLDDDFVGLARDKLAATVRDQQQAGIRTRYRDRSHDVKLVFYSPEGLSVQLVDTIDYDLEILTDGKLLSTQHVRGRYVAVLTPTEVRWKVRILQAEP